MPRPRPPHLQHERKRGRIFWYVRKGKGPRFRLRAEYGSEAFKAEYEDAIAGRKAQRGQAVAGTLQWLWDAYRKSDAWKALAMATRRQRENIMQHVIKAAGAEPFGAIREGDIVDGLDRRANTPSAARGQVTRIRNRVGHGVCPCCNRTFGDLARHMTTKHPTFTAEAAE